MIATVEDRGRESCLSPSRRDRGTDEKETIGWDRKGRKGTRVPRR